MYRPSAPHRQDHQSPTGGQAHGSTVTHFMISGTVADPRSAVIAADGRWVRQVNYRVVLMVRMNADPAGAR
jgi:hypothetical protein